MQTITMADFTNGNAPKAATFEASNTNPLTIKDL